jgi:DNA-binding CsgD family transcriptional regulator
VTQRASDTGEPFPPVAPRAGWRADGAELARRAALLCERAGTEFGLRIQLAGADVRASTVALADACARELRSGRPEPDRSAALARLASELQRLGDDLSQRTMLGRTRRLDECQRGLARLRDITTTAGLIDGVCDELIRSLGFKRTMLARVEGGMWRPWKANTSMHDEAWVADWIERAIPLDEQMLETRLLRERRPELVLDTTVVGIAQIVHAADVNSYVAAPIMPSGRVVGFFHADHGVDGRTCDVTDRDVLWAFAEGFGHLYERTALLEQLHARREQVRVAIAEVNESMDALTNSHLELIPDPVPTDTATAHPAISRQGTGDRLDQLSPRELDVLELIVAGARNSEIAERLGITVGTAKSHVRNTLGKLGAANRSQAIACYVGLERQPSPEG